MLFCEKQPYQNSNEPDVHPVFRGRKHVHLMSDTPGELVAYARTIGMKPSWLQHVGKPTEHFDATGIFMKIILKDDTVVKLGRQEFVNKYKELTANAL